MKPSTNGSTGMITKHEEALLHKFPYRSKQSLDKPSVLVDSGGRIILWYLPDAISPWIQADMEEATVGMGYLLKKSMTSGQETKWRTFSGYFHMSDRRPVTLGCINIAPCWFQQGREFQPHGFPPSGGFVPEVSATLKGGKWSDSNNIHAALGAPGLGSSSGDASGVVLGLRQCPLHRDPRSAPEGFDVMTSVGHYCDGLMTLSNLGIQLQYNSGAMVGCSGHIVRHGVTFTGDRIVWTWFIRDSLHNFVGTPRPQYVKYMDVDLDVSVSA
ncbi:hypothetical protein DFH29DRAFT_880622 [Suillus ampliporus]|nr:hypothetical protein DFH29DRAFT_880622 [Suillus ampliporus]